MKENKENTNSKIKNEEMEEKSSVSKDKSNTLSKDQRKKILIIRNISRFLDYIVLIISLLALFIGIYAFWDTHQVMEVADSETYSMYKPNSEDDLTFDQIRAKNPDVLGWIDLYGTNIDYPIVQGKDNEEYLNKTVLGKFSTTGSIFLDASNKKDFSDFQNILYGHYMAERKMFGDMELFKDREFFNTHKYGVIHRVNKKSRGIEFFAFLKTVGTDDKILSISKNSQEKPDLINHIYENADYSRKLDFGENENLVILDTCDLSVTNGRYILIGRLTDKVEENIFKEEKKENKFAKLLKKFYKINILLTLIIIWILLVLIYLIYDRISRKKGEESKTNVQ